MEIGPIAGIRAMPVTKIRPVDPELTAEFEIEPLIRPADDTYSHQSSKAAGGEDPDEGAEEVQVFPDDPEGEATARLIDSQVSIFA